LLAKRKVFLAKRKVGLASDSDIVDSDISDLIVIYFRSDCNTYE
jgi:hypothetical protein